MNKYRHFLYELDGKNFKKPLIYNKFIIILKPGHGVKFGLEFSASQILTQACCSEILIKKA